MTSIDRPSARKQIPTFAEDIVALFGLDDDATVQLVAAKLRDFHALVDEEMTVRYRREIETRDMRMRSLQDQIVALQRTASKPEGDFKGEMKPVDSSAVQAIGYDRDSRQLAIKFAGGSGRTRYYTDVSPDLYANIMGAQSIGQAVARLLQGKTAR